MTAFLLYGITEHNAALRHEVPIVIPDSFAFVGAEDTTWIQASRLEADRVAACRPDATRLDVHELGFKELAESGISPPQPELEQPARAVARTGIRSAIVNAELDGIRRAQRAAEAAMTAATELFARSAPANDAPALDGEQLTAERVRAAMRDAAWGHGAVMPGSDRRLGLAGLWPRAGQRAAAGAASDPGRCLAVRRGVRVLGGHDPHVRGRR